MFPAAMHLLQIKDLKDLSFFTSGGAIDMQVLKDLKRRFFTGALAGDRPPRYGMQGCLPFTVGRGPVPRHAIRHAALARDRPPRYGPGRGSLRHASVREQALPNYSLQLL